MPASTRSPMSRPRGRRLLAVGAAGGVLCACAAYHPLPLARQPAFTPEVAVLAHSAPLPPAPLSVEQVAALAVEDDPDLRAVRAQHGIAEAQLIAAGVLPNPRLGGAILPLLAGPGNTTAWNAALSVDVKALVTLQARKQVAREAVRQVDAQVLWQEWQVAGQARLLAVDLIEGGRYLALLSEERDLLAGRLQRVQAAVAAGNLTLASASPYVLAQQTAQTQVDDEARRLLGQRHQLNALLGLAPEIAVPLADSVDLPPLDIGDIQAELPGLAQRRPDLVALQLGYRAQDARLRVAILSQFPNLLFGVFGGSDNAKVRNAGPQVNMDLPLFDRNQGGVAIEQATRAMLHEEYAARLTAAHGQVRAILVERAQTTRQLERSRAELPAAQTAARKAAAAAAAGNLDQRAEVDLLSAAAGKAQQIVTLEQALEDEQVALATLVGAGLPAVQLPPEEARK